MPDLPTTESESVGPVQDSESEKPKSTPTSTSTHTTSTHTVNNLCVPSEEINLHPSLCVFIDEPGLDERARKICASEMVEYVGRLNENEGGSSSLLPLYCAPLNKGAVPQIKKLCKIVNESESQTTTSLLNLGPGGPIILILNIKEGKYYPLKIPTLSSKSINSGSSDKDIKDKDIKDKDIKDTLTEHVVIPTADLLVRFVGNWRAGNVDGEWMEGMPN